MGPEAEIIVDLEDQDIDAHARELRNLAAQNLKILVGLEHQEMEGTPWIGFL
jgi:hypothetical protein